MDAIGSLIIKIKGWGHRGHASYKIEILFLEFTEDTTPQKAID